MSPHYRAYCKKCGVTVKTGAESTWLDPFFFLPERCPGCHEYHSQSSYSWESGNLYNVEYGFWRFVPAAEQPPKVWFLPWTWGPVGERVWTLWSERELEAQP